MSPDPAGASPALALRARTMVAVAVLYFVQGMVIGLGGLLLTSLAALGVAFEDGFAAILVGGSLPWVAKLGWATLLDVRTQTRPARVRNWAIAGQAGAGLGLLALAGGPGATLLASASAGTAPERSTLLGFSALWFAVNACLALQDAATDAAMLDATVPADRTRVGVASQVGHYAGFGLMVMGLFYYLLAQAPSRWTVLQLFSLAGTLTLITAPTPLLFPRIQPRRALPDLTKALATLTREPGIWLAVALTLVAGLPGPTSSAISQNFVLQDLEVPLADYIGIIRLALVAGLVLLAAWTPVGDRLGRSTPALVGGGLVALTYVAYGSLPHLWARPPVLLAVGICEVFGQGLLLAGLYGLLMDLTHPSFRAVQFTLWMSLLNVGRLLGPPLAQWLVASGGYGTLYLACGLGYGVVLPLAWRLGRREPASFTPAPGVSGGARHD